MARRVARRPLAVQACVGPGRLHMRACMRAGLGRPSCCAQRPVLSGDLRQAVQAAQEAAEEKGDAPGAGVWRHRLHTYLDALFRHDPAAGSDYHDLQARVAFENFPAVGKPHLCQRLMRHHKIRRPAASSTLAGCWRPPCLRWRREVSHGHRCVRCALCSTLGAVCSPNSSLERDVELAGQPEKDRLAQWAA